MEELRSVITQTWVYKCLTIQHHYRGNESLAETCGQRDQTVLEECFLDDVELISTFWLIHGRYPLADGEEIGFELHR